MRYYQKYFLSFSVIYITFLVSCQDVSKKEHSAKIPPLFTLLPPAETKIEFSNTLTEGLNTNVLMYEYFYNGGGVAIGDVNNDGLQDVYFSANMISNKLYLNKGNMHFEDVTDKAGVGGRNGPWKTGVTMVDINGDGWLDIYSCYSGKLSASKRANQLYINQGVDSNGIPNFLEQANQFGLADSSFSNHSVFFDYDRDNDLDMVLLNHNPTRVDLNDNNIGQLKTEPNSMMGLKLFRNTNNIFKEVTQKSGLMCSALSYGLGMGVSDINNDGWLDMYISNDYSAPDYLYINNGDGTFTDKLGESLGHTSHFSMGNDVSDINNDGRSDIITLDMLPEDNHRQKLLFAPDNYGVLDFHLRSGLHHQYMRNMLHVNNGDGTFSEVGQLAGISNTDWSWAPLFADFDNDGWKDLFVTNGYVRDYTNMDFLKYMGDHLQKQSEVYRQDLLALVQQMPSSNMVSYLYKNNGGLTFSNVGASWGINLNSNSNGAAYADLDNDGDLDIVVNNINQPAFIYRNESNNQLNNHALRVMLEGSGKNTLGIGTKIVIYANGKQQYLEQILSKGYQSSVSPVLHFGLGNENYVDSLLVVWPGGKKQLLKNIKCDSILSLKENDAQIQNELPKITTPIFKEIASPLEITQRKSQINDFKRQPLMLNPISFSGPCLVKGDLNNDGREDVFAGGAIGQPGTVFFQLADKSFKKITVLEFENDKDYYDTDAVFVDANGDGFQDIYVASGGYHNFQPEDKLLQDRIYLGDGKGGFKKDIAALPKMYTSTSCVRVTDVNNDNHPDIFVGSRVIPGRYPETPTSYLLINDGKGHFNDEVLTRAPMLQKAGMVTDASWVDLNKDGAQDMIVVGEWMPVMIFINENGKLTDKTTTYLDKSYYGWWNNILTGDFNEDGNVDIVLGNQGLNTQCTVSDAQPAEMYYKDFDNNGSVDPILCFYIQGKSYPYVSRDEMLEQLGSKRKKFPDYKSYADATLHDIFSEQELQNVSHLQANYLKSAYFMGTKEGLLKEKALPMEVQFSPVYTITPVDFDNDGDKDLVACGNISHGRLRFGKYDANYGMLLQNDGKGNFSYVPQNISGFKLWGDVRSMIQLNNTVVFGINEQDPKAYKINQLK